MSDADFHAATALALGQVLGEIASLVGLNPDDGELYPIVDRVKRLDAERQQWVREAFRLAERDGWSSFGTHADGRSAELEFDGQDAAGMPLWERPKSGRPATVEAALAEGCGETCNQDHFHVEPPLCQKCRSHGVHDPDRPGSIFGHFCLKCIGACHDMSDESSVHMCVIDRWAPRVTEVSATVTGEVARRLTAPGLHDTGKAVDATS